ncbi:MULTISPECIES: hypothetical protein [Comamonas]|uniref:Uncharacterized protein n=1 Tax=Comamonas avium TaxID=2762231 RepID=A0ABR8SCY3_9BURK|nr:MULTISPECIES: hypothetical protein [Comamonas]MBD7960974.1 hypothetical protein [Comamonas avium]MBD9400792.1 hypothetical protein [Comamonas sp. CMM02]
MKRHTAPPYSAAARQATVVVWAISALMQRQLLISRAMHCAALRQG